MQAIQPRVVIAALISLGCILAIATATAPLVALAGTAAFVVAAALTMHRFNADVDLDPRDLALELLVCCANPIVLSQLGQARPDALAAACALVSFVLLDRLLRDDGANVPVELAGYVVAACAAIALVPASVVICPIHALWIVWRRRGLVPGHRVVPVVAAWLVVAAWIVSAKLGVNPLVAFGDRAGNIAVPYLANVHRLALVVALAFGAVAVVALPQLAVTRRDGHLALALGGYTHLLLVSNAATGDPRAFLPILPFATLYVIRGFRAVASSRLQAAMLGVFAATQIVALAVVAIHPGVSL